MMKARLLLYAIAWSLGQWTMSLASAAEVSTQTKEVLTDVVTITQKYDFDSKAWPGEMQYVVLSYCEPPELLWITGARLDLVGPDGHAPVSGEFVRYSCLRIDNLLLSIQAHNRLFGNATTPLPVQGKPGLLCFNQGHLQTTFPPGFAIPVLSHEPLLVDAAVVNQNHEEPVEIRFKWTVEYIRDQELQQPLRPLFIRLVRVEPPRWTVPPGREGKRFNVTSQLALPFDTTVHSIRVSLQPFGESLELRDLTTGTPDAPVDAHHLRRNTHGALPCGERSEGTTQPHRPAAAGRRTLGPPSGCAGGRESIRTGGRPEAVDAGARLLVSAIKTPSLP